ncbi:hypothetical protein ACH41H_29050 [Streptomyces sp. NPDC020800]|uniref:hypothetical protein n=1 Tax=Streptomyces sp. NPDC020800 TaxID=3365092 RepID=UPI0037B7ABF7
MADSAPQTPPLLLPDAVHQAVKPGTAVLWLETTSSREGVLDGARWPRTRHIETGLPAAAQTLIAVLPDPRADHGASA